MRFRFGRLVPVLIVLVVFTRYGAAAPAHGDEKGVEKQFILENGLKVFLYERHNLPLVNIVAAVNAGSKDETDDTNGIVHLLEHYVLFRGTEARSGSEIARDIRRHGAYFNAHTGQDMALFEISLPVEDFDFGLRNQREILFNLKIDPDQVNAEKEVVLEEVSQIQDDPFKFATALVYQNLFPGHPYGRPVFGRVDVIRALTADQITTYYKRFFVPANCALAIVGDLPTNDMEDQVRSVFGPVPKTEFIRPEYPAAPPLSKSKDIVQELDVEEAYLAIGIPAPDYNSPDQYAADVLTEILGRGINPLLYTPLKARRDLVNTASMSFTSLGRAGAFVVYLTLDPRRLSSAKNQAVQFLRSTRNDFFSKDDVMGEARNEIYDYLAAAKNQIVFDSQQAQENGLALANSLAMHVLLAGSSAGLNYLDQIKAVSSSDIRKIAAKYLSRGEYVFVSILPKKK